MADDRLNNALVFVGGVGVGAGLAYLLDPAQGRRRRHIVLDKVVHALHVEASLIEKAMRDVNNRTHGWAARARHLRREHLPDDVLVDRVRAQFGRCVTHPGSIEVGADDGCVTLSGPIFEDEVGHLLSCVRHVRGVRKIVDRLEPHTTAEHIPGLQGEGRRPARRLLLRESWMPSVRLAATGLGLGLCGYGARQRGALGGAAILAGSAVLARALLDRPLKRIVGVGAGPDAVRIQKTLHVDAPISQVFELWSHFEHFPRFMEHVREVRMIGEGLSHWKLEGPGRIPIQFDALVTRLIPNRAIAWQTVPGAVVEHAGTVHFEEADGGTRCHIQMSYNPPAGAVGHLIASLLGSDPKKRMDDDLLRMKSLLEVGKTRADGQQVSLDEIQH